MESALKCGFDLFQHDAAEGTISQNVIWASIFCCAFCARDGLPQAIPPLDLDSALLLLPASGFAVIEHSHLRIERHDDQWLL